MSTSSGRCTRRSCGNPDRELPPIDVTLEHDEAARYHRDWGRPGDLGIVAAADGGVVGVAYSRLFTHDDHGHGYLDDETPEVAVAFARTTVAGASADGC